MFENMVLRRIFGPGRDEVTTEWRRLHNEELNDLYCSPNIVRVIKSRRMRWAGHVARMGEERGVYRVLVGKLEGRRPLEEFLCKHDIDRALLQEVTNSKITTIRRYTSYINMETERRGTAILAKDSYLLTYQHTTHSCGTRNVSTF